MKNTFTAALVLCVVVLGAYVTFQKLGVNFGGQNIYEVPDFLEGIKVGTTRQFSISRLGVVTTTATGGFGGLQIDAGSTIQEHSCATLSWDPVAVSSSTSASTTITLPGAALGDVAIGSFASASSTADWRVSAKISGANTATVIITSVPGSATYNAGLDMVTSTARACYFGY